MSRSNLCENVQQKRFDYVAGALTGGFRQKNLNTKEKSKKNTSNNEQFCKRFEEIVNEIIK